MTKYGIGEQLTRARLSRNLTIEEAEQGTRISGRFLQALEQEKFEKIPAPVFAKGFLRSYAQFLGLNPQALLALYPQETDTKPARSEIIGEKKLIRNSLTKLRNAGGSEIIGGNKQVGPLNKLRNGGAGVIFRRKMGRGNLLRKLSGRVLLTILLLIIVGSGIFVAIRENTQSGPENYQANISSIENSPTPITEVSANVEIKKGIIPNVVGQDTTAAQEVIKAAGFVTKNLQDHNVDYPKGVVFDQSPPPGIELAPGRTITIMTSMGP